MLRDLGPQPLLLGQGLGLGLGDGRPQAVELGRRALVCSAKLCKVVLVGRLCLGERRLQALDLRRRLPVLVPEPGELPRMSRQHFCELRLIGFGLGPPC